MVNAQECIEQNFKKDVKEIKAVGWNLEGSLDLSEYTNLTSVNLGSNSRLTSLKLRPANRITWMSIWRSGINDFPFLADTFYIQDFCSTSASAWGGSGNIGRNTVAKIIRDINWEKDRQIQQLKQQLNQAKADNQNLQQQNVQLNNQLKEQSQELVKARQQNQHSFQILFPNQPYNLEQLKQEITRFKYQELAPQVRKEKAELERLITNAKTKAENLEKIIDLLLETQKQIDNNIELEANEYHQAKGQLAAYQTILESNLTKEELQTLLSKQTELCQLEKHLASLQQNQEQVAQIQQN